MSVRGRFLFLLGLRWFPVGLLIPVLVLLPLERGLTIAQVGAAAAVQGVVVLLLELPTGGLADSLGRRPVLLIGGGINLISAGLLVVADSMLLFGLVYLLQGIFRALDSGPLEAWYVDAALAADANADIETGLSRSGVVSGLSIAGAALAGGGLVALGPWGPVSALTVPVIVSFALVLAGLVAVALLMTEERPAARERTKMVQAVAGAVRLVRRNRVLAALVTVELFWGFGMVTFEQLTPVRLAEVLGGADRAGALMGPVGAGAWAASAAGAALVPLLVRRIGARWAGFAMRIGQGVAIAGMALIAGPAGIIAAFLCNYAIHGASNPVHVGLLHRQVDGAWRASVLSLNSMVGQPGFAIGAVVLTAIAASAGTPAAILCGAVVLAAAAPLYLVRARATTTSTVEFQQVR